MTRGKIVWRGESARRRGMGIGGRWRCEAAPKGNGDRPHGGLFCKQTQKPSGQPASPVAFCSWSSAMWVRSVLPPVPPCQRSAPGVESKATTLAAASSLLISPPKVAFTFSASGNSDDAKSMPLTKHLPRPASESRTWVDGGWHNSSSAILLIGRLCSGQFDKSSWAR